MIPLIFKIKMNFIIVAKKQFQYISQPIFNSWKCKTPLETHGMFLNGFKNLNWPWNAWTA